MVLSMDHRWGRRKITDAAVRFFALPGTFGMGRVTNVSVTGAFLETYVRLPLQAVVHVESLDPLNTVSRRRLTANVVRKSYGGVGLQWTQCASNSVLFSQFGSAYKDRVEFCRPELPGGRPTPELYFYQFDFQD
jgi:hypothetical protein